MTGTDLCVNEPHCAAAVRPWESEATTSTLPPARLEPVQSCLGVARVMSEQKVPRSVEQRIVIKFLVGENVPSAEIHHRLQQQYGEECLRRRKGKRHHRQSRLTEKCTIWALPSTFILMTVDWWWRVKAGNIEILFKKKNRYQQIKPRLTVCCWQ